MILEEAAKRHKDAVFASVDIEKEPELADEFNVRSVPWVMILREQVAVYDDSGALTASAMDELIEQARTLDIESLKRNCSQDDSE